jgi:hypothetical protein
MLAIHLKDVLPVMWETIFKHSLIILASEVLTSNCNNKVLCLAISCALSNRHGVNYIVM